MNNELNCLFNSSAIPVLLISQLFPPVIQTYCYISVRLFSLNLSVAVRKLQVAIIARSYREILKLGASTVGPSSHEFASQFVVALVVITETPKTIAEARRCASVQLNEPATPVTLDRQRPVGAATTAVIAATDWAKTAKSNKSRRRQRKFIPSRLTRFVWELLRTAHAYLVCNDYYSVCVMCLKYTIIIHDWGCTLY